MVKTPKGLRLHISLFGRRNVGKSSILNALVDQQVSIVSEVAGTTTDPVEKVMELKPIGPVVFIDTGGIDDIGALGQARIEKTKAVINRTELALLVTDEWTNYEEELMKLFNRNNIPFVVVCNKSDLRDDKEQELKAEKSGAEYIATTSVINGRGIDILRQQIINATPVEFLEQAPIISDIVKPDGLIVLVTPIDIEAPKGRLKMLQVHCIREILDSNANAMIVKETELTNALDKLKLPPDLVICDSQVFDTVASIVPVEVPATTFSILMARFKSDFDTMLKGTVFIETIEPGDKVLIAESCTHHPIGDDIGRVQIPALLNDLVGGQVKIDIAVGRDFPNDLAGYKLVIHCGACVSNRAEMLSIIAKAQAANVPITNYGMAIAFMRGILNRALQPLIPSREFVTEIEVLNE